MMDAPCSRIGHIYRKFAPFPNPRNGDFVDKVGALRCDLGNGQGYSARGDIF